MLKEQHFEVNANILFLTARSALMHCCLEFQKRKREHLLPWANLP